MSNINKMMPIRIQVRPYLLLLLLLHVNNASSDSNPIQKLPEEDEHGGYVSIVGDPGMKSPDVRVGLEAWNFCNEVGPDMMGISLPSPRFADCTDLFCPSLTSTTINITSEKRNIVHRKVKEADNSLRAGDKFPSMDFNPYMDPNLYAVEKELYLGSLCENHATSTPWHFWMIMLKSGNFDKNSTLCPENGKKISKIETDRTFPCFGQGCMNQPLVFHKPSRLEDRSLTLTGGFYGTYDLDADLTADAAASPANISYFSIYWRKNLSNKSWIFSHKLTTSFKYPWLMLYLRSDATHGFNGGYHYNGRGIMTKLPESPNFKVRLTLDVKHGGGPNSQFYLLDIGSCWKNNGSSCDGDVLTDVTRYSEMIINPATTSWCHPGSLEFCPPYHVDVTGEIIYRNDTLRFPFSAYHLYCSPGNAEYLEKPYDICDPYSNPQAQELVQILPHPEWAVHGYPAKKGDGWIGDSRTWELDVGALSSRLYFYQDPGTKPARRIWTSINVGTEIYVSRGGETAEWTVSDFDVLVPEAVAGVDTSI